MAAISTTLFKPIMSLMDRNRSSLNNLYLARGFVRRTFHDSARSAVLGPGLPTPNTLQRQFVMSLIPTWCSSPKVPKLTIIALKKGHHITSVPCFLKPRRIFLLHLLIVYNLNFPIPCHTNLQFLLFVLTLTLCMPTSLV